MSEKDPFKVEQDGYIAWLTLNRPDNRNVMGFAFFEELTKHFERFDEDSSVRAVVIKAEGKSFTAGLNLVEFGPLLRGKMDRVRSIMLDFLVNIFKDIQGEHTERQNKTGPSDP